MKILNINTTPGILNISSSNARFQMEITRPQVDIHSEQVQVQIDQQQCFNEAGLMDYRTFTEYCAQQGEQTVFAAIARISQEGDMLAAIQNKGNTIKQIAMSRTSKQSDYNIDLMPKSRPRFDFIGGTVDIKVAEGDVSVNSIPASVQINYQRGKINISI